MGISLLGRSSDAQEPGSEPAGLSLQSLPEPGRDRRQYKADPYIRAAAALQQMGKEKAIVKLKALATEEGYDGARVIVLCRMLFAPKGKAELRHPALGQPGYVGDISDERAEAWTLYPIAVVDGVPFLISWTRILVGVAEPSSKYLDYCINDCEWSKATFRPKTGAEKAAALRKLLATEPLKGVALSLDHKQFLESQIE